VHGREEGTMPKKRTKRAHVLTRRDIARCQKPGQPWDFLNGLLYEMCRRYPDHRDRDKIIAKLQIIGRVYAATIERGSGPPKRGRDIYVDVVGPAMRRAGLDKLLGALPDGRASWSDRLTAAVQAHRALMDIWEDAEVLGKRSLASKYLHFHRPDVFPILDSRAQVGIHRVIPSRKGLDTLDVDHYDRTYRVFCERYLALVGHIRDRFGVRLTLRHADNLLLALAPRKRRPAGVSKSAA
jgi:hypothetical protein